MVSELPFVKVMNKELPVWMSKVNFSFIRFGTQYDLGFENDEEAMKKALEDAKQNQPFLLMPSTQMGPDGVLVFWHNNKFYVILFSLKFYSGVIPTKVHEHSENATQLARINMYFPKDAIGGSLRVHIELPKPTNNSNFCTVNGNDVVLLLTEQHLSKLFQESEAEAKLLALVKMVFTFKTINIQKDKVLD